MTIKMPWRAEYWPAIIDELKLKNAKQKGSGDWPYFYDMNLTLRKILGPIAPNSRNNSYIYINDSRIIVEIIKVWSEIPDYSRRDFARRMKPYEKRYMHKAIYNKRKEEFDALVSETNS
tara:strand:- start:399 stop:755 length:357 start_codon:yes stop_codon:yes gene_type:complete